ncbi:hypothetical protein HHI36_001144 [Cryptolaemus montrouzieri]|uniref:Uncharacterized protein n=1 Tax=Cryptolaemus montrouzieri TaxID=559131 RepID=A0ABD2P712_9CUCU
MFVIATVTKEDFEELEEEQKQVKSQAENLEAQVCFSLNVLESKLEKNHQNQSNVTNGMTEGENQPSEFAETEVTKRSDNPLVKEDLHHPALCFVFALEESNTEVTIKNARSIVMPIALSGGKKLCLVYDWLIEIPASKEVIKLRKKEYDTERREEMIRKTGRNERKRASKIQKKKRTRKTFRKTGMSYKEHRQIKKEWRKRAKTYRKNKKERQILN